MNDNNTIGKYFVGDKVIILVVAILMIISSLLMGSTLSSLAIRQSNFSFVNLIQQLSFSAIAFVVMLIISQIPYETYYKFANPIFWATIALLIFTIVAGKSINSAKRWIEIPIVGFTIQTSDIVRIGLFMYVAKIISTFKPSNKDKYSVMLKKVLLPVVATAGIIAFTDLSTAIIIVITAFIILFLTPIDIKLYLRAVGIIAGMGIIVILLMMTLGIGRGKTWMNRISQNKTEKVYSQKTQALIAVANAPLIPKPGSSKQKYLIANSYSDYVFSILVEEYGYLGAFVVIALYLMILYRSLLIIKKQKRTFPMYLALALTINIISQAFVHIFVNVGIGPVTGQPLPLVSMGGSSTFTIAAQIGILLQISKVTERAKNKTVTYNETYDNTNLMDDEQKTEEAKPQIQINDHEFLID
jgi:cell division protein FtsW